MNATNRRFVSLVSPTMQKDRIKLSIMTTRSNHMQSPMYSSVDRHDELNGGFSYNGAATMRANIRNGNANIALANEKGRNNAQRSEMLNTLDPKTNHMPKLMLAQPLQFQG